MNFIITIDIGGTQMRVAVFPRTGTKPITSQRTASRGMEDGVIERLTALIDTVWPNGPVDAIAVAAPGPLNPYTGIIISTPNIPAWTNYPLAEFSPRDIKCQFT